MKRDKIKEKNRIEELIKQEKTNSEIAKELCITLSALRGRLRTYKLLRFEYPLVSDEQKNKIIALYNDGLNCKEIGKQFFLSRITISRILKKSGIELIRHATTYNKIQKIEKKCEICENVFQSTSNNIHTNPICGTCKTSIRRYNMKIKLMDLKGGKCCDCGSYDLDISCYEFHHLDPTKKDFNLSSLNVAKIFIEKVLKELEKCILLCSNCHRERHKTIKTDKFLFYAKKQNMSN
jgi:predicted DNA-binding protein YlxM (UPF0122 family)